MELQDNALYPLLHFVLDDLPTSTEAPDLDDTYTTSVLAPYGDGEYDGDGQVPRMIS